MPQNPIANLVQQRLDRWNAMHPRHQVDSRAVHAVGRQEGYSGRIGDGGHAFGPFQENDAGGVLTGRFPGYSQQQKQSWATSPAGIDDAISRIAAVSGGQQGPQAVRSIVSRFERPANIPGEIAGALAAYGGDGGRTSSAAPAGAVHAGGPVSPGTTPGTTPGITTGGVGPLLLQAIMRARQAVGTEGPSAGLTQLLSAPARSAPPVQPAAAIARAPHPPPPPANAMGSLAELIHEGVGGPTHSTGEHIHAAFTDPNAEIAAIRLAQQLGLQVRENPYVDPVDPVHAKNSYHYRTFPGRYNGRRLGQAVDVSGPRMSEYERLLRRRYGGSS